MVAQARSTGLERSALTSQKRSRHESPSNLPLTPEQRIKELEVQLERANEKAQLFEAMLDVIKKDFGVQIGKKPSGKSLRKSSSKA
jgi:transposase